MSELEDLEKFFPLKHGSTARPFVNDSDLQLELSQNEEQAKPIKNFDFEDIYIKYKTEEFVSTEEIPLELSKKTMDELEGAYEAMRSIHDQLVRVYKELIKTQGK